MVFQNIFAAISMAVMGTWFGAGLAVLAVPVSAIVVALLGSITPLIHHQGMDCTRLALADFVLSGVVARRLVCHDPCWCESRSLLLNTMPHRDRRRCASRRWARCCNGATNRRRGCGESGLGALGTKCQRRRVAPGGNCLQY